MLIVAPEAHKEGEAVPKHSIWVVERGIRSPQVSLHSSDFTWDSPVWESVTHSDHRIPPHDNNEELWDGT